MQSEKLQMNKVVIIVLLCMCTFTYGQNIQVDSQTYTPQQLIEDILIDSNCIDNVVVTNVSGGDFGNTDQSYGYFDAAGTTFPLQSGIVLSTGRLSNVPGPNTSLSDDDAPNWLGDSDLENALNESNTTNATIIEFEFSSVASQVSFRYLFASEEYQEGNSNTCQYSDLFGFLIKPANQQQYTNIALIPNTQTPVKVTTVHSGIPGSCAPINEAYFGSWNGANTPINFNGQTTVLTATADIVPNETYHVKLVIADEQNYRYDSAVFLEAGSFELSTNLGPDRLLANNNAVCEGETLELNAYQNGQNTYEWYRDGVLVQGAQTGCGTCGTYTVSQPGTYTVEVGLANSCISYGEVVVEYSPNPIVFDSVLIECDQNQDGITYYNLFDASQDVTNNDASLLVTNFYLSENDALNEVNEIPNASNFQNSNPFQTVYARVENENRCSNIAAVELQISNNTLSIPNAEACDGEIIDGFGEFDLTEISTSFEDQIPTGATVQYYETEADAFNETNALSSPYQNSTAYNQTLFVKVTTANNQCYSIGTVALEVLYTPTLLEDETFIYCLNTYPETITLYGGVLNDSPSNYYYEWLFNGNSTTVNTSFNNINEVGTYTVIVTDPNGCSASRTITVEASNIATIENITIEEGTFNNTISVTVSGEGMYEYALDNGTYQDESMFYDVLPGFHTVYVKDKNDCGVAEQLISVLGFPKFFSPNGDTIKDTWKVYGTNEQFNRGIDIKIFNRYGKLLASRNHLTNGWDGTFKGKALPSDDYWYLVTLPDGRTYRGHFALLR